MTTVLLAMVLLLAAAVAVAVVKPPDPETRLGRVWHSARWRGQLVVKKAAGAVPGLTWPELWKMTSVQGGFGLEFFANGDSSLEGAVRNAFVSAEDHAVGERIFRERCALCHGGNGAGWHAPPLNRPLKSGDSDFTIYRTIRDGIPGTAMVPPQLSIEDRWRVVGFVRTLQQATAAQVLGAVSARALDVSVPADRVLGAGGNPDEWLTYSNSMDGQRHVALKQLDRGNVGRLRMRWVRQIEGIEPLIEATPLVVDGVIFTTEPPSTAVAIDARTGDVIWRYKREIPDVPICCMRVNRGMAILDRTLYLGTLDGYLVALDVNTGAVRWETQVGDAGEGYTLTGAPLVVNHSVVIGIAGGEFGIRGYLTAYDATTGAQQWRFYTIPAPGEPGNETWGGTDTWKTGGGPTWNTGVYDPGLDLVYWGVGNPGPDFNSDVRPGDNLYTDSVIALHAKTGKLAWHFQFTPHDDHDWDATQVPILVDVPYEGRMLRGMAFANRNGFYYLLDRESGRFLLGKPFVELNWALGLDEKGRPIPAVTGSSAGKLVKPGNNGGTNWQNAAFDPGRNLVFVHATEGSAIFTKSDKPTRGERGTYLGSGGTGTDPRYPYVRAIGVNTGVQLWEYASPLQLPSDQSATVTYSGLLSTAGGLVFGASGGFVFALDASTGEELWKVFLGGSTMAPPISFRLDGQQVLLVAAGRTVFLFGP